ncbi:hypothetical protein LDENG_00280820 [Lucifuga dentata]|nr:hypothetical protein LDENG_00280820 [Lucifuga dentata]
MKVSKEDIIRAQWLALSSHSKKVLGSIPGWGAVPFCVEFACSPHVCVGFLQVLQFPHCQKHVC